MCVCDEQPEMKRFCDPISVYCHHETGRCLNQTEAAEYFPERFNRTSPCYYVDGWQADDGLVYMVSRNSSHHDKLPKVKCL